MESTLSGKTIVGSGHGIKAMIRCSFIILVFMSIVFILLTVFSLTMESSLWIPFLFILTDVSFRPKRLGRFTGFLEQKSCCASASGHSKGVLLLGEKYRHKNHRIPVDLLREMCYALSAGSPALAGKFSFMGRQVWTIIFLQI